MGLLGARHGDALGANQLLRRITDRGVVSGS
jgi:hypothetical protein